MEREEADVHPAFYTPESFPPTRTNLNFNEITGDEKTIGPRDRAFI